MGGWRLPPPPPLAELNSEAVDVCIRELKHEGMLQHLENGIFLAKIRKQIYYTRISQTKINEQLPAAPVRLFGRVDRVSVIKKRGLAKR